MRSLQSLFKKLKNLYPEAHCSLSYKTPFQLLIATILSAQCRDERVNKITPILFLRFPTPLAMSKAKPKELEKCIRATGFYRHKAKNIIAGAKILHEKYGDQVPPSLKLLIQMPGIGRKTANVVLGNAFHSPEGVVVDTHVKRISFRLGLTQHRDPLKVEQDLNRQIPRKYWIDFPHWLITHGRLICHARHPKCPQCSLLDLCAQKGIEKKLKKKKDVSHK